MAAIGFPAYVILLVVLIIIVSLYLSRFSNLIGKKDPVAMLATLILISYAKLLEVCFKSLSVGILVYPDGTCGKPDWAGIYSYSLLMAVAPLPPELENISKSKAKNFY